METKFDSRDRRDVAIEDLEEIVDNLSFLGLSTRFESFAAFTIPKSPKSRKSSPQPANENKEETDYQILPMPRIG